MHEIWEGLLFRLGRGQSILGHYSHVTNTTKLLIRWISWEVLLYNRLIFAHIWGIKRYHTRMTLVFLLLVSSKCRVILNDHIKVLLARHLNRGLLLLGVCLTRKVTYIYL